MLYLHKQNDTNGMEIQQNLKLIYGKNKRMQKLCFSLEMLVFKEA